MRELMYALPPGTESAGADWGLTPAHMAWRIVPGPKLVSIGVTQAVRGGAMYIACSQDPGPGDAAPCCRQIVSECQNRQLDGVICDFEGADNAHTRALANALGKTCAQSGLSLYLPVHFASEVPSCRVLISSIVTSGTLERRLLAALEQHGPERTVLAVEAVAMDFLLPASGPGIPMTADALKALMSRAEPAVFFDRGLCANYFTYMATGCEAHFILFDTPQSVRAKLDTAQRLGVSSALLAAPQVESWLVEIFS